jgi:hypothetical protein
MAPFKIAGGNSFNLIIWRKDNRLSLFTTTSNLVSSVFCSVGPYFAGLPNPAALARKYAAAHLHKVYCPSASSASLPFS